MAAPKGNLYGLGNNGGRPREFPTPEDMEKKVNEYFEWVQGEYKEVQKIAVEVKDVSGEEVEYTNVPQFDDYGDPIMLRKYIREPEPITVTGLCLYIGFSSKQQLYDYGEREGFKDLVKRARMAVEREYEGGLHGNNPTGRIFALKNMGWKDQTQHELSGPGGESLYKDKSEAELMEMARKLNKLAENDEN